MPRGPGLKGPGLKGPGGSKTKSSKPKKPTITPGVKMRGLFWSKVPDTKVDATLWKTVQDDSVKVPVADIEKLFCADDPNKGTAALEAAAAMKKAAAGNAPKKSGPVMLLDGKRQQNAGIALARLKMAPSELRSAVLEAKAEEVGVQRINVSASLLASLLAC